MRLITLLTFLFALNLNAQVDTTKLFYAKKFESDAFVQAEGNFQQIAKNFGLQTGFSLNWLVNNQYYLGGVYNQLASVEDIGYSLDGNPEKVQLKHQSAGLRFGYILFHEEKFSFSPDITLSWANAVYEYPVGAIKRANFGMVSPSLNGISNFSDFFRIGVGVYYNAAIGLDLHELENEDLSGIGGKVFLRFGKF